MFRSDPFALSARLGQVADKLSRFDRQLRSGVPPHGPLGNSRFPEKRLRQELLELDPTDPLRTPLLAWAEHLAEARVHVAFQAEEERLLRHAPLDPQPPFDVPQSLHRMRAVAIAADAEGQTIEAKARWRAIGSSEQALSDHRMAFWARRREYLERLGAPPPFSGPELTPKPTQEAQAPQEPRRAESDTREPTAQAARAIPAERYLTECASRLLEESRGEWRDLTRPGWSGFCQAALGHGAAADAWPARLSASVLIELCGGGGWAAKLHLENTRLPSRLSPTSFSRAAFLFGRALGRALAPTDLPFVARRSPHEIRDVLQGRLFELWTLHPEFLSRMLGVRVSAEEPPRLALRAARLAQLRLGAVRCLLASAAMKSGVQIEQTAVATAQELLGEELPTPLGRFAVTAGASSAFAALLLAYGEEARLIEAYDVDWPRNPRAQEDLRAAAERPGIYSLDESRLETGLASALSSPR